MTRYFSVRNFDKFQHYRDRNPPWIKLYNSLLGDCDYGFLPDASKSHLLAIWLLASRSGNRIPWRPEWIAGQISATEKIDLDLLLSAGFIYWVDEKGEEIQELTDDASMLLPSRAPAHSREGETEGEGEYKKHCNVAAPQHDDVSPKKKNGLTEDAQAVLEFLNLLTNKNYRLKNPNGKLTANGEIIIARLKDGYETEVLTQVIAERNQEWKGTDMAKYLRPVTLFNKTKFAQYVGSVG